MGASRRIDRKGLMRIPKEKSQAAAVMTLPDEVRRRIKGTTIDMVGASKFNLEMFKIVRQRLASSLTENSEYRYRLNPDLFRSFLHHLGGRVWVFERDRAIQPADSMAANLIAEAMWQTAWEYKIPPRPPRPNPAWPPDRPISEAWPGAADSGLDLQSRCACTLDGGVTYVPLRLVSDAQPSSSAVFLCFRYDPDITQIPKMTVEVMGAPISVLIRAAWAVGYRHHPRMDPIPKETKQVLKHIFRQILSRFKVGHTDAHRPPSNNGWNAARLHHHDGLSWTNVAARLCPEKHSHGNACREKYRKQAEQYWKRCKAEISQLPPV
jgi:hypothetical protein